MTDKNSIGKPERATQNRVIQLFQKQLGYTYLGNWEYENRTLPVEEDRLSRFLIEQQGYSKVLVQKAVDRLLKECRNLSGGLYETNKKIYHFLRYGIDAREELGQNKDTLWLINWEEPHKNDFAIAEEVTVVGKKTVRPDLVLYVNGIALGIIELKSAKVSLEEGIRQNRRNQRDDYVPRFFTSMQLVFAGNDTQGLRYGTTKTAEKYFLKWKEENETDFDYVLDKYLSILCEKERFLELIHDFIVFDKGTKKICRPNQYFGIKAAHQHVRARQGGILWHTQGSGKSLTMVWLTKWIRERVDNSRVLIITDREELDDQIQKLFTGVEETVKRIGYHENGKKNNYPGGGGKELIDVLDRSDHWLICSLVHKFGRHKEEGDFDAYIEALQKHIHNDFRAKGDIYVFVDECHRTQSGKLHAAMKMILPDALFIGFTGTPLLKKDKQKSIEVFGPYIGNPYKFDEAVEDGVVLDLLYEARDVEQFITDQQSIDEWFEAETQGLTDVAKTELKKRWGTMQKVLGSKSRLEKIVFDIVKDFKTRPRLAEGNGNAMLVSGSIYQACKYYELFQGSGLKECAIITSYQPHHGDIKNETTGEGTPTEKLLKYEVYQKMLKGKSTEDFEAVVKNLFKTEPARMKLLIVVDKLLTGFDAPSATYLYIDKSMQDHGLFQAICRVNRVHDESKEYGYIIDYKDLFRSLHRSITDYTSGAFDDYDPDDVKGLLTDRYTAARERLDTALETVIAICEPVYPREDHHFIRYFCGNTEDANDLKAHEEKRLVLYKAVAALIRAYANIANELHKIGFSKEKAAKVKQEVKYYSDLRDTIKEASRDRIDLKVYEPGMRQLMDMYLDAKSSKKISDFENKSLVELILKVSEPEGEEMVSKKEQEAMSEKIENNIRRVIIEESQTNPKFYEKMSSLLGELVKQRKEQSLAYQEYLERIKKLAEEVESPSISSYPAKVNTKARQALYDNLEQNEILALALDQVILTEKLDGWRDGGIKEKKLRMAVHALLRDEEQTAQLMDIIKAQREY